MNETMKSPVVTLLCLKCLLLFTLDESSVDKKVASNQQCWRDFSIPANVSAKFPPLPRHGCVPFAEFRPRYSLNAQLSSVRPLGNGSKPSIRNYELFNGSGNLNVKHDAVLRLLARSIKVRLSGAQCHRGRMCGVSTYVVPFAWSCLIASRTRMSRQWKDLPVVHASTLCIPTYTYQCTYCSKG